MRGSSRERVINGVVSALIVVFFLVHGTLGAASTFTGFVSPFAWLVWVGVALVGVHVIMSIVTSRQQLSDKEHPPSPRKVRHLVLKWCTGGLLAIIAGTHIVLVRMVGVQAMQTQVSGVLVIVVLAIVLAVHLCVGSKSLLKDLGIDRRYKTVFRVVVCVIAAAIAVAAIAGVVIA